MDAKALEEKIKLLEHVIDLQKQLLEHVQKVHADPVYYPYIQQPLYDHWRPWTTGTATDNGQYQYTPTITSTTLRRTSC